MIAHLHVHSYYSFFDSTLSPAEIARLAAERGFCAAALTDSNSLAGAPAFAQACKEAGIQPIFGVEVDDESGGGGGADGGERALVLARDWEGWGAICRLITDRHLLTAPEPSLARTLGGVWVKGGKSAQNARA